MVNMNFDYTQDVVSLEQMIGYEMGVVVYDKLFTDDDVLDFDILGYDLSPEAANVEYLFTPEGLAEIRAEAKVKLANKLGVTVEYLEDNANAPVSSLEDLEVPGADDIPTEPPLTELQWRRQNNYYGSRTWSESDPTPTPTRTVLFGGDQDDYIHGGVYNDIIFGENPYNDSSNIAALDIDGSFNYGQSTYLVTKTAMTWSEAQAIAESMGGNLVTINDFREALWLHRQFGYTEPFWNGMNSEMTWVSGQALTYSSFQRSSRWKDGTDTGTFRGIIEIDWSSEGGNDILLGGVGDDQIYGNSGNDKIYGDYGDYTFLSGEGHDTLTGNGGNDTISGGGGDDTINGTDEMVAGYYEIDILTGGNGADKFILGDANQAYYATGHFQDYAIIEDFDSSVDKIQLQGSVKYYIADVRGTDTFLYRHGNFFDKDLIAVLENTNSVNLTGSAFEYVGT